MGGKRNPNQTTEHFAPRDPNREKMARTEEQIAMRETKRKLDALACEREDAAIDNYYDNL